MSESTQEPSHTTFEIIRDSQIILSPTSFSFDRYRIPTKLFGALQACLSKWQDSKPKVSPLPKIQRYSRISLPKKPSYTIRRQTFSVCPRISRGTTVQRPEGLHVPNNLGGPGLCEDICSIHNPIISEMRAKVAAALKKHYIA